jgi:hypothetical protein
MEFVESWIGFDLDGTLAISTGVSASDVIGPPVERMVIRLQEHVKRGDKVKIFTARVGCPDEESNKIARAAIEKWCVMYLGFLPEITNIKDIGMRLLYDDRARQVIENTGIVVGEDE